jgi:hypothetical protein
MLKCVEFLVNVEENVAEVAALTLNLPVGTCTIQVLIMKQIMLFFT